MVATDDISGVHYQKVKIALGADGALDNLVDSGQQLSAASLPVVLASDHSDIKITLDGETVTVASHAVTNAGTFAVQESGSALTALQLLDNIVYVDDADWTDGTSSHALVGGLYQSTPQTVTDGDVAPFNITANGALHVAVQGTVTVASHAVTNAGTFAVQAAQSGTWTVDLGATDNAVLDNIDGDLTTIIGHVDGIEGLLTTIDGDTGSILTAVQLIDNLVLAEDATHQTGDPGVMLLAVRQDTQADFGADGDYVPLSIDADGQLRVAAGVVTASADSEYADDADWTDGTSVHTLVGGLYQSTPQTVTDGDVAPFNITANGALHVAVQGTVTVGSHAVTNAGTFAVQAAQSGTWTVDLGATDNGVLDAIAASLALIDNAIATGNELQVDVVAALPAGTNNIGDVDAIQSGTWTVDLGATDNAVLDAIAASVAAIDTDATTIIGHVDGIEALLGTIDADTGNIVTAVQLLDNAVYVDDADWTGDTSSHLLVGGVYQSVPQTVTDGDVAPLSLNVNGALRVTNAGGALTLPNIDSYTQAAFNLTAAANQVLVASAANKQIWVYGIGFVLSAAGTVSFQDQDDTAITGIMPFAANSGMTVAPSGNFAMPLWKLATDKDFEVDLVTAEMDGWISYAVVSV